MLLQRLLMRRVPLRWKSHCVAHRQVDQVRCYIFKFQQSQFSLVLANVPIEMHVDASGRLCVPQVAAKLTVGVGLYVLDASYNGVALRGSPYVVRVAAPVDSAIFSPIRTQVTFMRFLFFSQFERRRNNKHEIRSKVMVDRWRLRLAMLLVDRWLMAAWHCTPTCVNAVVNILWYKKNPHSYWIWIRFHYKKKN